MKEITNPYQEGQEVVCISESFKAIITTLEDKSCLGKQAPNHPKLGEVLVIDEILGDYLNFKKFNIDGFEWFHWTRFAPVAGEKEVFHEELYNELSIKVL